MLLDRDYSGAYVNAGAYAYLRAHGVQVRWAPAHYIFHIKATSFDDRTSDISTANLTAEYYSDTRDATVIDTNPAQVKAIEQTFANDWAAAPGGTPRSQTVQAPGPGLVAQHARRARPRRRWSRRSAPPATSSSSSPRSSATRPSTTALAAAARRGVSCRIVMTESSEWDAAFAAVTRAGCQVHVFPDSESALYIHEKLVLDDPGSAQQSLLIGSQNASWDSLHENRELGVLIAWRRRRRGGDP